MPKYECDCGRVFGYPDGPIMCADSGHGQKPVTVKKLKPILHVCENGEKEDVADKIALGFKYCCWCGERYADAELMDRIKAAAKGKNHD